MTYLAITTSAHHQDVTFTADSALVEETDRLGIAEHQLLSNSYEESVDRCYGPPGQRMARVVGAIEKVIVGHDFMITAIGCPAAPYLWQIGLAKNPDVFYFDQALNYSVTGMRSVLNALGEIPSSHVFFAGWSKARQRAEVYRYTHPDYQPVLLNEGHVLHPPPASCYLEADADYERFGTQWEQGMRPGGAPAFHRAMYELVERAWHEGRYRLPIAFARPLRTAVVTAAGVQLLEDEKPAIARVA